MANKIQVEFNTREYEMSHGKVPRGRGGWAFSESRNPQPEQILWSSSNSTLAEAKKEVKARLAAMTPLVSEFVQLYILP